MLGIGIVNSSVRNESDPAIALLSEHINDKNVQIRISAILGLGLAYAGTAREDIRDLLLPLVSDLGLSSEIFGTAALALGMIFVGTSDGDISSTILQTMMEREDAILKESFSRFLGLGLGLLFLSTHQHIRILNIC